MNPQQQEFDLGEIPGKQNGFNRSYQTEIYAYRESDDAQISKGFLDADLIPFFISDKRKLSITGAATAEEASMSRAIEVGGQTAKLEQRAANIEARAGKHKGTRIYRHLGEREESVLHALKYIASVSPGKFGVVQGAAALKFSLGQIAHCLDNSLNKAEIAEALDVLNGSITELIVSTGKKTTRPIKSSLLPLLVTTENEEHADLFEDKDGATFICTFHPIISSDVSRLNYRVWDHDRIKNRGNYMARWIEKKLSMRYTQAAENVPYTIKGSTLLLHAGLTYDKTKSQSLNFRPIERALKELVLPKGIEENSIDAKDFIIKRVDQEEVYAATASRSKKVVDYKYTFHPMPHFVDQQRIANAIATRDTERLETAKELNLPAGAIPNIKLNKS